MAPESKKHVGWVVSERFINMPMEIMPPMYNMMQEETKQAKQNVSFIGLWISVRLIYNSSTGRTI